MVVSPLLRVVEGSWARSGELKWAASPTSVNASSALPAPNAMIL
jgi:hypothetical protein